MAASWKFGDLRSNYKVHRRTAHGAGAAAPPPPPRIFQIDHMHMTSQKGAPACWGSNEALPRAPSPSMQPEGQPLHAIPPGRPGRPGRALTEGLRAPTRSASTTRARSPTSLDPQHGVVVMET